VVTVNMRQADPRDPAGRNAGVDHLPLGALAGIEEQALTVPKKQVTVVIALPRRHLRGGTEDYQFTHGTECLTLPRRALAAS